MTTQPQPVAPQPRANLVESSDHPVPDTAQQLDSTLNTPDSFSSRIILAPGKRPLPDYELVHLLGKGGFGEVWKAIGAGGFEVALKFIGLGGQSGSLELQSLELIKNVRHPHLLATFGAWQCDNYLIIAMELADRTLLQRLQEAQQEGLTGIPAPEVLEYMREVAKGIDYLNEPHHPSAARGLVGIQHKDVKPQNLLLVGGSVKVADFGLAKLLEHTVTSAGQGLTPAYAAPEFFEGKATRWSDQYCLAVSYCQLRGGRLPFEGGAMEVMAGHLTGTPNLTMLPESERSAVARALAKRPEDRWPNCRAFVDALASGGGLIPATVVAKDTNELARPTLPSPAISEQNAPTRGSRPWRKVGLLGLLLLLVTAAILVWTHPSPLPPLSAQLGVRVQRGKQKFDDLSDAIPIRKGDKLQFVGQVDRPAYLRLIWLDQKGIIHRLADSGNERVREITHPASKYEWLSVEGGEGTEMIILLATDDADAHDRTILPKLEANGACPACGERAAFWLDHKELIVKGEVTRGPGRIVREEMTELRSHLERLRQSLADEGVSFQGVAFPRE